MKFMTGKRTTLLVMIILLGITAVHIFAQGKKKKAANKVNTHDQITEYDSTDYHYFLFPQFYTYWPIDNNDTILKYECYDVNMNFINVDTLYNISDVQHISFVKIYTNYTQTYIDADGKPRPQPVMKKLYKYDRTGTDTWAGFDYINHYSSTLKEYRNDIVKTDTTIITDPITGTRQLTIRKYYKVLEIENPDSTVTTEPALPDQTDNAQKSFAAIYTYTVPEFYFYLPKKNKDTILEFKCYDFRDSLMHTVENYDSVRYYSLFKSFTDSAHTYKDINGERKLLPVSSIIKRYDRIGNDRWMTIEYPKNKYQELAEYKNAIVSSDTVTVIDPINDKTILKVFNHYKVAKF